MAKKTVVQYYDDLDDSALDNDDLHTIEWTWSGVDYAIDTSTANLERIEGGAVSVATLLSRSTRVGGRRRSTAPKHRRAIGVTGAPAVDDSVSAVRRWAREQGYDVGIRGRIPKEIEDVYREAHA
ncbi:MULTISPECIES: Lsr2 family protein [Actinomycetes]|uniref:histone-like nucleoid-structuring protein Lsr2 n=1 Tax=Actinomycetes TaxID=1760 RepID=UPI000524310D